MLIAETKCIAKGYFRCGRQRPDDDNVSGNTKPFCPPCTAALHRLSLEADSPVPAKYGHSFGLYPIAAAIISAPMLHPCCMEQRGLCVNRWKPAGIRGNRASATMGVPAPIYRNKLN